MVNVSAYPITVDGRRLDDLAIGLETSSVTLGALRSGDQPLAGLDGEVASLSDSREPGSLALGMLVRGTDPDGFVPTGLDGQAQYRANLQTLKHLLCKQGALLDVRRVVDKAQSAVRTNMVANPTYRSTSGTVTVRTNYATNPAMVVDTAGMSSNVGAGNAGTATRQTVGGPVLNGQTLNYYRVTIDSVAGTTNQTSVGALAGNTAGSGVISVTPGLMAFSASVRANKDRPMQFLIQYYDVGGATIGGLVAGPTFQTGVNTWTRQGMVDTAPAGAVRCLIRVYGVGAAPAIAAADTIEVTGILSEVAGYVGAYFDGASPAAVRNGWLHRWTGTVGQSTSEEYGSQVTGTIRAYSTHGFYGAKVAGDDAYEAVSARGYQGSNTIMAWADVAPLTPILTSGAFYAGRFQARSVTGTAQVINARVAIYAPSNVGWLTDSAALFTLPADGSWVDITMPALTALPAGLTNPTARIMLYASASVIAGSAIQMRRHLVEQVGASGTSPGPYFDGASAGGAWSGTVDLSTSTSDSRDVQASCKVVDSITPEDSPGDYGRLTVVLKVLGAYWRSLTALTWSQASVVSGTAYAMNTVEGSSAPIEDAVVCLTGPADSGVQVLDDATGYGVRLNEALPAGSVWRVNSATWESRVGVGLTVDSADTAGTDKAAVTDQTGTYPRLLRLHPRDDGTGRRLVKVKAVGTGFTAATALAVKARRAYL